MKTGKKKNNKIWEKSCNVETHEIKAGNKLEVRIGRPKAGFWDIGQ